ncbi:hypothetical protein [Proteus mirabilis]|uniref:hypothetical protein n=1 Tax=Proteus mirabilis TaxID=584 RepID=UPI00355780E5
MFTTVICVKAEKENNNFNIGEEYKLFNGYITDNLGKRWVWNSWGDNFSFEVK